MGPLSPSPPRIPEPGIPTFSFEAAGLPFGEGMKEEELLEESTEVDEDACKDRDSIGGIKGAVTLPPPLFLPPAAVLESTPPFALGCMRASTFARCRSELSIAFWARLARSGDGGI